MHLLEKQMQSGHYEIVVSDDKAFSHIFVSLQPTDRQSVTQFVIMHHLQDEAKNEKAETVDVQFGSRR